MLKSLSVSLVGLLVAMCLTACAPSAAERSEQVKNQLLQVIAASTEKFHTDGGSETTQTSDATQALIFNPQAPEHKRVVTVDISDSSSARFGDESRIALASLESLISGDAFAQATFSKSGSTFNVESQPVSLQFRTRDNLLSSVTMNATVSGQNTQQVILFTYGLSEEARAIFESAK